jgi:uncharacterized membrane protein
MASSKARRVALAAIMAAIVPLLNAVSGPLSLARPPLYVSFRLSTPAIFTALFVDPWAAALGGAIGQFLYDGVSRSWFSALLTGFAGTLLVAAVFYRTATLGGTVTVWKLALAGALAALTRSVVVASTLALFGTPWVAVFLATIAGTLFSNFILTLAIVAPALRWLKRSNVLKCACKL